MRTFVIGVQLSAPARLLFTLMGIVLPLLGARDVRSQFFGGGRPAPAPADCVSVADRQQIELAMARPQPQSAEPFAGVVRATYPFIPIAGTLWDDRFVFNFVDLDASSGILDWDCTDWTYDGHQGHDIDLRSFGEQDAGVPVFAALDGTVTAAHDGEFDRNTSMAGQPANYVVLSHGGTHFTWYYHLRKGSVAVAVNQAVKAGTQLGLAASSGNSTGPHLHFESRYQGTFYEPSAGPCRAGESFWVNQAPIRRDLYLEDFAIHDTNFTDKTFLPADPKRTGTFFRGRVQKVGCWFIIHNQPAQSTWQLRYLRPDGSLFFDSAPQPFNNEEFFRYGSWWFYYNLDLDVSGTWQLELLVNGQRMIKAPFLVLDAGSNAVNRPPNPITAGFDPAAPSENDVIFCRLQVPLLADPDYDLVRFRFEWTVNQQPVRDVTIAAHADAVPRNSAKAGDLVRCTVTPFDGVANGSAVTAQILVTGTTPIELSIERIPDNRVAISWEQSGLNFILQSSTNLSLTNNWSAVSPPPVVAEGRNRLTNSTTGSRFYRLLLQ